MKSEKDNVEKGDLNLQEEYFREGEMTNPNPHL